MAEITSKNEAVITSTSKTKLTIYATVIAVNLTIITKTQR